MTSRQRRHGVSPVNQNFHEQNGAMILKIVGVVIAVCFWPFLLKAVIGVVVFIALWIMAIDFWNDI